MIFNNNNYFASLAETTKNNIKYSHEHFSDYLKNQCGCTIFLQHTRKEEIGNIISFLKSNMQAFIQALLSTAVFPQIFSFFTICLVQ